MIDTDVTTHIANECLLLLGEPPLNNLDNPQSYAERWIKNRMDHAIREILELRPWTGAISEAVLQPLTGTSQQGYARYAWPLTCARINHVRGFKSRDWETQKGLLIIPPPTGFVADSEAAGLQIAFNDTRPSVHWSASLMTLIGHKLAMKIIKANENSNTSVQTISSLYQRALRTASAVEGANQSGYVWREDLL